MRILKTGKTAAACGCACDFGFIRQCVNLQIITSFINLVIRMLWKSHVCLCVIVVAVVTDFI